MTFSTLHATLRTTPRKLALGIILATPSLANASGAEFQNYFFDVCTAASGALAARCGETTNGEGNLSGDSESSLDPNMGLSVNDGALSAAKEKSREFTSGDEPGDGYSGVTIDIGPFSLLANLRSSEHEAKREQDVDNERGNETESLIGEIGLDYRLSERSVVGFLIGYEDSEIEFDQNNVGRNFTPQQNAGEIDREAWSLTVFGSLQPSDNTYIQASAGLSSAELDITRRGTFQESTRTLEQVDSVTEADTDADNAWASIGAGWTVPMDSWSVTLNSSLTWATASTDGYTEKDISGSGLAMQIGSVDRDSMVGSLGISVDKAISTSYGVWVPFASLDYEYEFDFDPDTMTAKYLLDGSDSVYAWSGDTIDEDSYFVGAGVQLLMPDGWAVFFDYREQFGNDSYEMQQFTLGMRLEL